MIGAMFRDEAPLDKARRLRRDMTEAESKLWHRLRRRQLDGYRFRRQVPIGGYFVDFACLGARLVVEIDGGQHKKDEGQAQDAQRTRWLQSKGYRVLRFWNSSVLAETHVVLETIFSALTVRRDANSTSPQPCPPPAGRGEVGAITVGRPAALLRTVLLRGASSTSPQPCPPPAGEG
jgi:very-short-patch-repair endonuclease